MELSELVRWLNREPEYLWTLNPCEDNDHIQLGLERKDKGGPMALTTLDIRQLTAEKLLHTIEFCKVYLSYRFRPPLRIPQIDPTKELAK